MNGISALPESVDASALRAVAWNALSESARTALLARPTRANKALVYGLGPSFAILLGMLTGIGGGIARDVLVAQIPLCCVPNFMSWPRYAALRWSFWVTGSACLESR